MEKKEQFPISPGFTLFVFYLLNLTCCSLFSQRRRHLRLLPQRGGETQQEEQREETQEQEAAQTQEGQEGKTSKRCSLLNKTAGLFLLLWLHVHCFPQKKKHKKHKHKGKQQKKSKKEASDSSSEDSEEESDGEAGQVSTDELLKRFISVYKP